MKLPTININGTHRSELQEQNYEARAALRTAIEKLNAACPHGRDFQTQDDPTAIYRAMEEHADRVNHLRLVLAQLETIGEHLA